MRPPARLALCLLGLVGCSSPDSDGGTGSGGAPAISGDGDVGESGGTAAAGGGTTGSTGGTSGSGGGTGTGSFPGTGGGPISTCTPERAPLVPLPAISGSCNGSTGELVFETAEFCVHLDEVTQTLRRLIPKNDPSFDFAPSDRLSSRSGPGYAHLGDLSLRYREVGTTSWQNEASFLNRSPIQSLIVDGETAAAADLGDNLGTNSPLLVTRSWGTDAGRLTLDFTIENTTDIAVEIGALGAPMVFNNIISNRSLEEAHARCSFSDPYVGKDAGYLQVTRLSGEGPALLVLPKGGTSFEAHGPLLNPPQPDSDDPQPLFPELTPRNQTFEGFHEWLVHTTAYAENEWAGAVPWNAPTSTVLEPGASETVGFRLVLAPEVRQIEETLLREQRPVTVAAPGYVLPTDVRGKLFLHYPSDITTLTVEPLGALEFSELPSTETCYRAYEVRGAAFGRARLTVSYADGIDQTIHFSVIDPAEETVSRMGRFLTTEAWYEDADDPFGRSPSVMTYDRDENTVVLQDKRAWVCGLGDDGGATWLAGIMKLGGLPDATQVEKYERFVDEVVWGGLQYSEGPNAYGVKRTLFYYEPGELPPGYYDPNIDWNVWSAWSRAHTEQVPRSYNYPHVAALYFTLYRLARNTSGLVTHHTWDWYLDHAYRTAVAMTTVGNQYTEFGVMDGSVYLEILDDLVREGWSTEASDLEARMESRAEHWATLAYPFGSEMAWDSTGQEEVYMWSKHFENEDKAQVTLNAILGYTPSIPHWGYNGSARRYWDFIYGGAKIDRLERMLHHYGSSLNAIPALSEYRDHPDDFHLLRIGHAGMMGPLTNIDEVGFPSMGFHAFADTLAWEVRTGDYGLAFYGHAAGAGTYLMNHPEFGWLSFGGNVDVSGSIIELQVLDSFKQRVYLAPIGVFLTLDSGQFEAASLDTSTGGVTVRLAPATDSVAQALLRVSRPGSDMPASDYAPDASFVSERGGFVIPLGATATEVPLGF